jgi:phage baseplate assembly protein W
MSNNPTTGVNYPATSNQFYATVNRIWPDLINRNSNISPPRNGMNKYTGKICQSWEHVEQSMSTIFSTPFHERVLRRWVGSFVPSLLGENYIARIILRFYWALASAIDLWEPDFRITQVQYMGDALAGWSPLPLASADELIRQGQAIFRNMGVWRPRAHLGDVTPYQQKNIEMVGRGNSQWNVVQQSQQLGTLGGPTATANISGPLP